jgi:hypothetical protein
MNNSDVYLCTLGRLVMADPLCFMKELAVKEVNPQLLRATAITPIALNCFGFNSERTLKKPATLAAPHLS